MLSVESLAGPRRAPRPPQTLGGSRDRPSRQNRRRAGARPRPGQGGTDQRGAGPGGFGVAVIESHVHCTLGRIKRRFFEFFRYAQPALPSSDREVGGRGGRRSRKQFNQEVCRLGSR
jgi:hypothetical protein